MKNVREAADDVSYLLDWIDARRYSMLKTLMRWAGINTHSFNVRGLSQMAGELEKSLRVFHEPVQRIALAPFQIVNTKGRKQKIPLGRALYVRKRPQAEHQVLFVCHMDTVYAPDHPFQRVTFKARNQLVGPGVTDAKGGIVVLLTVLQALERSSWKDKIGWQIFLNPDEEIASPGSSPFLKKIARNSKIGLVYEPCLPNGALVGERKGSGNFTLIARGRAAHAGRDFEHGRNAIGALAECVYKIERLSACPVQGRCRPGLTINMGTIEGGRAVNIVAAEAAVSFNIRVKNKADQKFILSRIKKIVTRTQRSRKVSLKLSGQFFAPPKILDRKTLKLFQAFRDCGRALGLDLRWRAVGGVCDGNRLAAAGLPTVDSLGGKGGKIHQEGEFLYVDSLAERAKLSVLFLAKLAKGIY